MEATIKALATKDDIANVRKEIGEATTDTLRDVYFLDRAGWSNIGYSIFISEKIIDLNNLKGGE